jgi:flagellar motor switch protein FliG
MANHELTGVRKSAILLLSLGQEQAAAILKRLPPGEVEQVGREIAALSRGQIKPSDRQAVLGEFFEFAQEAGREGNDDDTEVADDDELEDTPAAVRKDAGEFVVRRAAAVPPPFAFLRDKSVEELLALLRDEDPRNVALVLAHLPAPTASEVMAGLPGARQVEVVKQISGMEHAGAAVIEAAERGLRQRLEPPDRLGGAPLDKPGGTAVPPEILDRAGRGPEKGIIESLAADDPDLMEQLRGLMFVFEDVLLLADKDVRAVLREVDAGELSLALRTATADLQLKVYRNLSEDAADAVREKMLCTDAARIGDVEAAQQKIVEAVRRLEDRGEIMPRGGRGGDQSGE